MLQLSIRTDNPIAELYLLKNGKHVAEKKWQAHRELLETIHSALDQLFNDTSYKLADLQGVVVFSGGGSFTGLRIGATLGNALAYSYGIPVVTTSGDNWQADGFLQLQTAQHGVGIAPDYGQLPHITVPRK